MLLQSKIGPVARRRRDRSRDADRPNRNSVRFGYDRNGSCGYDRTTSRATTTASPNLLAAAAATSTNPIVLENQKQGTPQSVWDIDGAGSSNIEGFATDISVDNGNRVDFKINTNSSNYRIEIYRLGYYGGMGARLVTTIQHTGVQNQPAPLRDATTGLVDAGNWSVSASWNVPADAVSGVYIAKLVRQDGTFGENHIPFIVRDDSSTSDIVFQTSDTTWQAYNGWGGANFYGGNGPATGQGAGRAYAVSYNRPIATRGGVGTAAGPQDYLFGAEYSAIYWLEQNGYDVSYMAGVDVDRYGSLLLNHNLYLDVGHDEYWSGQQRANVQAARDAGVNLAFWSGNEMYWRTRYGNSISSDATAYRTLISYKETWSPSASIDPSNEWTGTFRDPRLSPPAVGGGIPENALIGQMFQVDDVGANNGAALQAITIPYDDANLRFWRNTSVANLQPGQTATLTENYLGYEWDEAPDNGFDPAGLVRLSSTTLPVNTYLLDYGNTVGSGVSTHNSDALSRAERRIGLRRRNGLLVVGPERQSRPGTNSQRPARATGDGQPFGRHGHSAGNAAVGAGRHYRLHGLYRSNLHHQSDRKLQCRKPGHDFRHRIGPWRRRDRSRGGVN